jgi:hypothetical protein
MKHSCNYYINQTYMSFSTEQDKFERNQADFSNQITSPFMSLCFTVRLIKSVILKKNCTIKK